MKTIVEYIRAGLRVAGRDCRAQGLHGLREVNRCARRKRGGGVERARREIGKLCRLAK